MTHLFSRNMMLRKKYNL